MLTQFYYPISITYRFVFAFVIGFLSAKYLSLSLALLFHHYHILPNAEAIYLAAFISIIYFVIYVIYNFIVQSLIKLTILSLISLVCFYSLSQFLG
ncbi:hypothetical protein B9T31_15885 [Acinetobacter sp. ANC 4558]|nr:hypothetical protein B9T31_15885 [Acinetobacter sp. ANC 4558]